MLVMILNGENRSLVSDTVSSLHSWADDWTAVPVEHHPGPVLQQFLADYQEPFFLICHAGDVFTPSLARSLAERETKWSEKVAGLFLEPFGFGKSLPDEWDMRNHPVAWRTEAVKTCLPPHVFHRNYLPFGGYLPFDMMVHLQRKGWAWNTIGQEVWKPMHPKQPAWRHAQTEWSLLKPLLEAHPAADTVPRVSVVISSYNSAPYLMWAIRSVCAQSAGAWELIVIDDGSTDSTREQIRPFEVDSRIRLITHSQNRGKAFCLNQALEAVKGEWMLELDADDWLEPHAVELLVREADSLPSDVAVLYADHHEWIERHQQDLVYRGCRQAPRCFDRQLLLTGRMPIAPRLYRVAALKKIGGWLLSDPFGGRLYEDFQMLIRLSFQHALRHLPRALYHRRLRPASISHQNQFHFSRWANWVQQLMPPHERGGALRS